MFRRSWPYLQLQWWVISVPLPGLSHGGHDSTLALAKGTLGESFGGFPRKVFSILIKNHKKGLLRLNVIPVIAAAILIPSLRLKQSLMAEWRDGKSQDSGMFSWAAKQPIPALPLDFVKYEMIFPLLLMSFWVGIFLGASSTLLCYET